jgi:ribonuclease-3
LKLSALIKMEGFIMSYDTRVFGPLEELEKKINYVFKDKDNLILALTHSSYANENKDLNLDSNERIEFLGDSVLNITVTEYLYNKFPDFSEGEMTKIRANLVCEASLAKYARKIDLGEYLLLGKGEKISGGNERDSLLSDALEALIGVIYLDDSIRRAMDFILNIMEEDLVKIQTGIVKIDYKTSLQEILQKDGDVNIRYSVVEEIGPDHDKVFVSEVSVNDFCAGTGTGKSKKESEQNAAKEALKKFKGVNNDY